MQSPRIPTRPTLRRAALVVALLVGSSTAVAGMSSASSPSLATSRTESGSAHTVARVLPSDRAIMLIEGRDPANVELTFVISPVAADSLSTQIDRETRLNICVPCDNLA